METGFVYLSWNCRFSQSISYTYADDTYKTIYKKTKPEELAFLP